MEITITTVTFLLLGGLILSPIIILRLVNKSNIQFRFITYLTIGLIVTGIISLIFAWWSHISDIILLRNYGGYVFNPDSNSYQVSYEKVLLKNVDRVKSLETNIMGIGWPLKAVFVFVSFLPIILIIYFLNYLISKIRKNKINIVISTQKNISINHKHQSK